MNPRSLLNIGLLLALVIAVALFYFKPNATVPTSYALVPAALEQVERIEIERPTGMHIVLARTGQRWRMQRPLPARLDEVALARVLDIARAKAGQALPATDLARFGLDKPWARVRFNATVLEFGATNTLTQEIYVLRGDRVYTAPVRLASAIPSVPARLLSHRLFGPDEQPAAFQLPNFSVREDTQRWRVDPQAAGLSQDDLLQWVDQWRLASSIVTQPRTDAKARQAIAIALKHGPDVQLSVLATNPDLVIAREDERLEYHLPARMAQVLLTAPGAAAR